MQDPRSNTRTPNIVMARATVVATVTRGELDSCTTSTAIHAARSVAVNRDISKKNASAASGGTTRNVVAMTTGSSGHTGSARSSSTAGARGWSDSRHRKTAHNAPPNHAGASAHRCSKGLDTRRCAYLATRHQSRTATRCQAGSGRSATFRSGAQKASPNRKSRGSSGCAVSNKPKRTIFGS